MSVPGWLATLGCLLTAFQPSSAVARQAAPQRAKVADVAYPLAVAPDGRRIAVIGTDANLALLDVATSQTRNLTTKPGWPEMVIDAVFSPTAEQIAYAWHNEQDFDDLRVVNTDGSGLRVLYRDSAVRSISVKDWSPNRRHILIALLRYDSTSELAVVPASGGPPRVIKRLATHARDLAKAVFSPNGRYIAYDAAAGTKMLSHDIFIVSTAGDGSAVLVRHASDDRLLGWSPNGKSIVFASNRSGTVDIWRLRVYNGPAHGAPDLIQRDLGQMIPFGLTRDGSYHFATSICDCHVYVASLDSRNGAPQHVTERVSPAVHATGARWSPDGRYLAYVTPTPGVVPPSRRGWSRWSLRGWSVAIRSMETGEEHLLPVEIAILHQLRPSWSPDGRRILVFGWDANAYPREVAYAIDVETGKVTGLLSSESLWKWMFEWVTWSADGTALFYADSPGDTTTAIVMRELESGRQRDLVRHAGPPYFYGLTVSPDGQYLAFGLWDTRERKSSLAVWSLTRNERRVLHEFAFPADVSPPAWYPDSKHLLYDAAGQLWRVSVDGGQPERIGTGAALNYNEAGLSIHPDGNRVAFVQDKEPQTEVWVIRSLLRGAQH